MSYFNGERIDEPNADDFRRQKNYPKRELTLGEKMKMESEIRQALARAYCTDNNKEKALDIALMDAMLAEVSKIVALRDAEKVNLESQMKALCGSYQEVIDERDALIATRDKRIEELQEIANRRGENMVKHIEAVATRDKEIEALRKIVSYAASVRNDIISSDEGILMSAQCKDWVDGLIELIQAHDGGRTDESNSGN